MLEKGNKDGNIADALELYNKDKCLAGEQLAKEQLSSSTHYFASCQSTTHLSLTYSEIILENGLRLAGGRTMSDLLLLFIKRNKKRSRQKFKDISWL